MHIYTDHQQILSKTCPESFLQESDKGKKVLKHFNGCQNNGYYLALIKDDNTGIPADTCNQCMHARAQIYASKTEFIFF